MNPALWGLATALGWGSADFIARFTGRALGHRSALLGMLGVSAVVLTLIVWLGGLPLVWDPSGWWLVALTGLGVVLGVTGALALTGWLSSLLFEVEPGDPAVLAAVAATLAVVAALAGYLPARRATAVDPIKALRHD